MTDVRVLTNADPAEFVAFVALPGCVEVRVRFSRSDLRAQWRCDDCGIHRFSTCDHELAARKAWQQISQPAMPTGTRTNPQEES